jgi:hypothetical protein
MDTWTLARIGGCLLALSVFLGGAAAAGEKSAPLRWRAGVILEREDVGGTGVFAVALSPDGTRALTGHDNGTLRLWNALTGTELEVLRGAGGKVRAVRFLSEGEALSVTEKAVRWWGLPDGKWHRESPYELGGAHAVAVSPDGKTAALAVGSGKVRIHDLDGKTADFTISAHGGLIMALAWSADGKVLATGGPDGTVKVWQRRSERPSVVLKSPGPALVRALAFSADGNTLASAHGRLGVILWDIKTGKERRLLPLSSQTWTAVAFSPDGKTLASGTANGTMRLWDVETGKSRGTFKEHAGQVHALAFAPDGKALASVSFDGTVRLWRGQPVDGKEPDEPRLTARELEILLRDLRGDEGAALQAMRALGVTPRQTVALLKAHMRPVAAADPKRVARLLVDLDNPKFAVRTQANKELKELGEGAHSALLQAIQGGHPLEVQRRARLLLERLEKAEASPELTFARRAIAVLERLATAESRQLLTTLAGGVPDAHLTRYARDALKRLEEQ